MAANRIPRGTPVTLVAVRLLQGVKNNPSDLYPCPIRRSVPFTSTTRTIVLASLSVAVEILVCAWSASAQTLDHPRSNAAPSFCASGTTAQTFSPMMQGCSGSVAFANRAVLVAAGYHVCTSLEWVANFNGILPTHNYWTLDALNYGGGPSNFCSVVAQPSGTFCLVGQSMLVCSPTGDSPNSTCPVMGCGLINITPRVSFGGCSGPTAGTLACGTPPPPAASGLTVTNITGTGMSVSWTGTSSEFRAIYKQASVPTSPTDGTLIFEGAGTSANVTGLAVNTRYFVAVYGKESGVNYSPTAATTSVITAPTALISALGFNSWDRRTTPTRQGKVIFADNSGNLDLFDGTSVVTVQPKGAFATNPNTVFTLGTAADPAHLIAAWRRDDAYVSTDGGTPFTINAANPVSPGTHMDAEVITVDGGCVFAVLRAQDPGTGNDRRNAFRVDPSNGNATDLTNNTTVYGVNHMSSGGCSAAWLFENGTDFELQFYNGSSVTTLDHNLTSDPSIAQGRIVYAKHVAAGNSEVFLYDTNAASPSPVQLTNDPTKTNDSTYTDGRHAAWVRRNLDTTGPELMLNGGFQLSSGNFALLENAAAPSFDLDRGQILWRDATGVMHHETSSSSSLVDTIGSPATSIPWLADGRVVFFDGTASPSNVYRFTGQLLNDSLQPAAPMFLRTTAGSGSVTLAWDAILGATSYNVYYATQPGLTKANYISLGGVRITGVTSPNYVVSGLAPNAPYYFIVTTVDGSGEGPESRRASAVLLGTPSWAAVGSLSSVSMFTLAADPTNANSAYASGGNNPFNTYASTDGGQTWTLLGGGIAGVDVRGLAANSGTVFATSRPGLIYRSTNGGGAWNIVETTGTSGQIQQAIAIDPAIPTTIVAGDIRLPSFNGSANDSDVIRSDDDGATWFHTPQLTPDGSLVAYSLSFDPSHTSTLLIGGNGTPNVAKSLAGGAGWLDINPGAGSGFVYTAAVDPKNSLTIYAGTTQAFSTFVPGVWKSVNGGTTWTQINTGLPPSTRVHAIIVDPADSSVLHIGTETGYFDSTNAGASWAVGNTGLPNANAQFINSLVMTGSHHLIAATADGLYLLNLSVAPAPTVGSVTPPTGNVGGGTAVTISGTNFQSGATVTFGGVAATNVAFVNSSTITATTPAHTAGAVDVVVHNPDGQTGTKTSGFTYTTSLAAPANVVAAASSTTQVNITWNAVDGATSYQVSRRSATSGGAFTPINPPATTNAYSDTSVTGGNSYLYVVHAVNASTSSPDSAPNLATTILFTNDPIVAGSTVVKAIHLAELRNAANAVRLLAGAGIFSFVTGAATSGTTITAAQINEVRGALDGGMNPLSLPIGGYTDTLTAGVPIKAIHFQEIRNRVK